jgi:molybdenum cofactor cytidylyltransferase
LIKNAKIGVVILAAGSSSRLGYAKQQVEFRGKTLLQHAIDVADLLAFDSKVLVLGANYEEIKVNIDAENFEVKNNKNWKEGMASSIRQGLVCSQEIERNLEHLLILLSDQPFVNKDRIEELISLQVESKSPATFSEYAGEIGVPAIFSAETFPYLSELKGDMGARKLIINEKFDFQTVKFEKGNFDVDTKEDIELLKQLEEE